MADIALRAYTDDSSVSTDPDLVLVGDIEVAHGPIADIATDAGCGAVVVTNPVDHTVAVIDADGHAVADTIGVDGEPFAAVANDGRIYVGVSTTGSDAVTVVDVATASVIATYKLAFAVTALAVSPDGKRVYAGRAGRDHVDVVVIDLVSDRVGTIDLARGPARSVDALRVDAAGRRIYAAVSDQLGGALYALDAETMRIASRLRFGSPVRDIAITSEGPDGYVAYVLTADGVHGGTLHTVDLGTNRVIAAGVVGDAPTQMTMSADGGRVYLVDGDHVAVFCTAAQEVVDNIDVGPSPSCVTVSGDGERLYVADYSGYVTELSIAATRPLRSPQFIAALFPARRDDVLAPQPVQQLEPAV